MMEASEMVGLTFKVQVMDGYGQYVVNGTSDKGNLCHVRFQPATEYDYQSSVLGEECWISTENVARLIGHSRHWYRK